MRIGGCCWFVALSVRAAASTSARRCKRANVLRRWVVAGQANIQTAWETLKLLAYGFEPKRGGDGERWNRERVQEIDLRWHDLRHEGACRLLADGVDLRTIQLMLGHASLTQTQRYLNLTDEELRRGMEVSWQKKRLRLVSGA
jgi:integrase